MIMLSCTSAIVSDIKAGDGGTNVNFSKMNVTLSTVALTLHFV